MPPSLTTVTYFARPPPRPENENLGLHLFLRRAPGHGKSERSRGPRGLTLRDGHHRAVSKEPFCLSPPGPPDYPSVHGGSERAENSRCWDLRGQLRAVRCSGHHHDRHTTEECGRRHVRRLRGLHTSGLPRRCYPGAHPRHLPDVLTLVRRVEADRKLP